MTSSSFIPAAWQHSVYRVLLFISVLAVSCKKSSSTVDPPVTPPTTNTFTNPLMSGSDPWIYKKDSLYYYTQTMGNKIVFWKTKKVSALSKATFATVYSPTINTPGSANLWAPELYFFDDKWYAYYTAGDGSDHSQRLWVLENNSADPMSGTWTSKGRVFTSDANFWSIDGTVLEYNSNRYFIWSGRPDSTKQNQNIYIAKMTNPWTIEAPAVMLSKPDLAWETNGGPVNEGPEILKNNNGQVFLIYSASGCWTDDYSLGMLCLADGSDPLQATNWTKSTQPVFSKAPQNNAYGPGHCSFFKSANGSEDWIIYHANTNSGEGCGEKRNIRIQQFTWNADGTPNFGTPVKTNTAINLPGGESN